MVSYHFQKQIMKRFWLSFRYMRYFSLMVLSVSLLFYFTLFYFWPCLIAWEILASQAGNKPTPPAVEAQEVQSLSHWTARKSHVWSLKSLAVGLPYTLSWASSVQKPTLQGTKICQIPHDWAWQWISVPIVVTPPGETCWQLGYNFTRDLEPQTPS